MSREPSLYRPGEDPLLQDLQDRANSPEEQAKAEQRRLAAAAERDSRWRWRRAFRLSLVALLAFGGNAAHMYLFSEPSTGFWLTTLCGGAVGLLSVARGWPVIAVLPLFAAASVFPTVLAGGAMQAWFLQVPIIVGLGFCLGCLGEWAQAEEGW